MTDATYRELLRSALHPRLLLACVMIAVLMVPVGICLAAIGIAGLQLSGGAATDTSLVVAVIAVAITDFWGGALVHALTKLDARRITVAWSIVRTVMLIVIALLLHRLLRVLPFQILLMVPAVFTGARIAVTQSRLRADARRSAAGRAALAAATDGARAFEPDASV